MLIEQLEEIFPSWMQRAKRYHWFMYAAAIAAAFDAMIDGVYESRLAAMPGQVDVPGIPGTGGFDNRDALGLIGDDRMVSRGGTETDAHYAGELRRWREIWAIAATPFGLLERVASVLSPAPPVMRIVTSGSVWYTREVDGAFRMQTPGGTGFARAPDGTVAPDATAARFWDWDSLTVPPALGQGDAGRLWLIIYFPCNMPFGAATEGSFQDSGLVGDRWDDPTIVPPEGDPDGGTIGTTVPAKWIEGLRTVGAELRAAGLPISHWILAFDAASFAPDGSSSVYPDGYWGHLGKLSGNNWVRSRLSTARYARGVAGLALA